MTPARMAELHAAVFHRGQVWPEGEIAKMLQGSAIHPVSHGMDAFALLQIIPPEAELLTIVVAPEAQGRGLGSALLHQALGHAATCGAGTLFLEVSTENAAARALYAKAGFVEIGRRKGYYKRADGHPEDAIVLTRSTDAGKNGRTRKT